MKTRDNVGARTDATDPAGAAAATSSGLREAPLARRARWLDVGERFGLPILLVLTIVVFAVLPQSSANFASVANTRNILADVSVSIVVALAALGPLVSGEFDFSIGLIMEFSSIAFAACVTRYHLPLLVAVLITLALACVVGSLNGSLVAKLGLNSFIVTFGMSTILVGAITWYLEGLSILVDNHTLSSIGGSDALTLGIPRIAFVVAVITLIVAYILGQTPWGRQVQAVGNNRVGARLVGLPVDRTVFLTFVGSAVLSAVAGMLYVAQQGAASPNVGANYVLPAFAAVFLGSTAFRPGRFNVAGTVVAQLFVLIGSTGLVLAGLKPWVQYVFQGGVLILALAATRMRRSSGAR
jgi:ribose transport system permease protein